MSNRLKLMAALNVLGWIVVVPVLVTALLDPFVHHRSWPGDSVDDRRPGAVRIAGGHDPGPPHDRTEPRAPVAGLEDRPPAPAEVAAAGSGLELETLQPDIPVDEPVYGPADEPPAAAVRIGSEPDVHVSRSADDPRRAGRRRRDQRRG